VGGVTFTNDKWEKGNRGKKNREGGGGKKGGGPEVPAMEKIPKTTNYQATDDPGRQERSKNRGKLLYKNLDLLGKKKKDLGPVLTQQKKGVIGKNLALG